MSEYDEQEELEKLKAWWKNYGNALIFGVVLGAAVLFGYRYWTQYQEQRLQDASTLYNQLILEMHNKKTDAARKTGESLVNGYSATPYAGMAGLLLARLDIDAGDAKTARAHLQWVIDHAKDPATVSAARLRLARLLIGSGEKDAALALLNVKDQAGFEGEYEELRGDIYAAEGKRDEARAAYREALKHLPAGSTYIPVLNMKLDDLGPGRAS
ncbi:MAG TPA: tetratricopeptide repeat protein [Candidatus Methylomirabilis sp.]|nr:tetratricopeptide repeat protein [Candidatus Methylomirabilis sp.]